MTRLILVVDDNDIIVEMLVKMLTHWGYAVQVAANGRAAVNQMLGDAADLVIMDLALPGDMSGITAARAIRNLPEPKCFVPIIALTGGMLSTTVAEMKAAAFATVLQKPVLPDDLRSAVEHAIAGATL